MGSASYANETEKNETEKNASTEPAPSTPVEVENPTLAATAPAAEQAPTA